jgi:hypothetical protein
VLRRGQQQLHIQSKITAVLVKQARAQFQRLLFTEVSGSQPPGVRKMSVKGEVKEAAGYVKEELNEHGKSPESQKKAQEGRDLRNEGRIEDGKAPKTSVPGTGQK